MEKYNKYVADSSNIEFVHISLDSDKDAAEEWAAKEKFPWLTVLPKNVKRSGLREAYKTTNSVPEYHLVDSNGKTIVAGTPSGEAAFAKIAELAIKGSE